MKKLILLLGLFIILPLCKMQAWDIEGYFGVKLGMSRTAVTAAMQKYYDKVKSYDPNNNMVIRHHVKNDAISRAGYDLSVISLRGKCLGQANPYSLVYPVLSSDRIYCLDTIRVEFKNNVLTGISCAVFVKHMHNYARTPEDIRDSFSAPGYKFMDEGDDMGLYGYCTNERFLKGGVIQGVSCYTSYSDDEAYYYWNPYLFICCYND